MGIRLYYPHPLNAQHTVTLDTDMAHRITRVMRMRMGDSLVLFDGKGTGHSCLLQTDTTVLVEEQLPAQSSPSCNLSLAFGVSQSHKVEWVVQKATELGVDHLYPIIAERSFSNQAAQRYAKQAGRLEKVITQACEQSGRFTLPTLHPPMPFKEALTTLQSPDTFFALAEESATTKPLPKKGQGIVWVGPEGGFSSEEKEAIKASPHSVSISLGPYTLRCETACIAALAVMQDQLLRV